MLESEMELKTPLMKVKEKSGKSWLKTQQSENRELNSLLMKVKEESEKVSLKFNIQKTKIMEWSHHFMSNRRGNSGNSGRFYFLQLQNHCRWWLQPWNKKTLTPWKKDYDQPRQHIIKQRHYFANKGPSSQSYVFPVVMYECECWTIKKAACQRIDAFELWCWRRLLRVPWTARTSNQSILKEISPGCSLEGLMLKLKLQYLGHLMWRADFSGRRRRRQQRMKWLDSITPR